MWGWDSLRQFTQDVRYGLRMMRRELRFASVAVLTLALGIYGVTSYAVTQRTQEIGIRIALGARAPGVLRLVVGQEMKSVLLGTAIGLRAPWRSLGCSSTCSSGWARRTR